MASLIQQYLDLEKKYKNLSNAYLNLENENKELKRELSSLNVSKLEEEPKPQDLKQEIDVDTTQEENVETPEILNEEVVENPEPPKKRKNKKHNIEE